MTDQCRVTIETSLFHDQQDRNEALWEATREKREALIKDRTEELIEKEIDLVLDDAELNHLISAMSSGDRSEVTDDAYIELREFVRRRAERIARLEIEERWEEI